MNIPYSQLNNNFGEIVNVRSDVIRLLEELNAKIHFLKNTYSEFIKNNGENMFLFSLDALRFQSKMIDVEYDDMMRILHAINNRMYCEYFKIHKYILEYIIQNTKNDKIMDTVNLDNYFTPYKDLEPYRQYDFEELKDVHEKILVLISALKNYIVNKEQDLKHHRIKNASGLNIDNFVSAFNYHVIMVRENLELFVSYLEYFHKLHLKYFKRFYTKVQLMYTQIMHDIKFDKDNTSTASKKSLLEKIAEDTSDTAPTNTDGGNLMRELKKSIKSSTDSFESFYILQSPLDDDGEDDSDQLQIEDPTTTEELDMHSIYGTEELVITTSPDFLQLRRSNSSPPFLTLPEIKEQPLPQEIEEPSISVVTTPPFVLNQPHKKKNKKKGKK